MINISVIIPTYNRSAMVKEAIESVFVQSYQSFELIVVDDGSTDNTPEMLAHFGKKITLLSTNNNGPSAARNKGIKAASGEYIAFLDSDDLWLPEKLKKQVDFFNNNPDALLCQTQEIWIRNGVRVNPKKRHKKYGGWIFDKCLPLCAVSPSSVMLHRTVFETAGLFDETLPACEDYDLWLRIAARYPIYLIDEPLIKKRGGHLDQQSKKFKAMDIFRIRSLCKILESGLLTHEQYRLALRELKKKCVIYGNGCMKRGREKEGEVILSLPNKYKNTLTKT